MFKPVQLLPFLVIYALVVALYYRSKKTSIIQQIINLSFFIYALLVIGNTLLPLPLSQTYIQMSIEQGTEEINNFIPFMEIYGLSKLGNLSVMIEHVIGELILLAPLGFYAPLIWKKFSNMKSVLTLGFIASIGLGLALLTISTIINYTYQGFVTDNIILNALGVLIGFLLLKLMNPLLGRLANQFNIKSDNNQWV